MMRSILPRLTLLLPVCAACTHQGAAAPAPPPAVATGALHGEAVATGDLQSRLLSDSADLLIHYGSEHRGSLEPCGCPHERRGGLPRMQGWIDASRQAAASTSLVLHAGYWLEDAIGMGGSLREDVPLTNQWMVRGMEAMQWTAINVAYTDLPGLEDLGPLAAALPLTSANIEAIPPAVAPRPWIAVEQDGHKIGILGITQAGMNLAPTPQYQLLDPIPAAERVLEEMEGQVEIIVLLVYRAIDEARTLAQHHPEIDLVIDAWQHHENLAPFRVGQAVWVKTDYETHRVGELRLTLSGGRVTGAWDRKIDLDPDIPDEPALLAIMDAAHVELMEQQREVFGF